MQIVDKCSLKADEVLGVIQVPLREVVDSNRQVEREYPLDSRSATGYVAVRLAFNGAAS